jgi:hypothetical protein
MRANLKRAFLFLFVFLALPLCARANQSYSGWCEEGNQPILTSGLTSLTLAQVSHPLCQVYVYVHGGGLATIYSDNIGTVLSNPFTAQTDGQYIFYAANGRYDVTMQGAGFTQPITYSDILLCDLATPSGFCSGGGGGGGGTVFSFASGNLPPLFTTSVANPTTNPVQSFSLTNAAAFTVFGNGTGSTGPPSYYQLPQAFLTSANETASLPNSRRLASGVNTTPNVSVTNQISLNAVEQYQNNGTFVGAEPALNLVPGTNVTLTPFTDSAGTRVNVTLNSVQQYQNNGLAIGAEPIFNLIPGTGITFSPFTDSGGKINLTINSTGGGGSGCTVSTLSDTWVVSIHPAATCYGSADFTWDDTTNAQNLMAGDGSNTNTGAAQTFIVGVGVNETDGCQFSCFIYGESNDLHSPVAGTDFDKYALGTSNSILGSSTAVAIGAGNDIENGSDIDAIGHSNAVIGPVGGNFHFIQVMGNLNDLTAAACGGCNINQWGVWGDLNSITQSAGFQIANAYTFGANNNILSTTGNTQAYLYGNDNAADSTPGSDVAEFGESNSATNIIAAGDLLANDNAIVGMLNTMTNVGNGFAAGGGNALHDCHSCYVFGQYQNFGTSEALAIGFAASSSSAPQILVTPGHVSFAGAGTSASLALCTDSSNQITTSGCPTGGTVTTSGSPLNTYLAGFTSPTAISGTSAATIDTSGNVVVNSLTVTPLTAGRCVQTTTGGLFTVAAAACGTSSGTITATGSPASGNLAVFSGATSITNGNLSADVTTSGTLAATVVALRGLALPTLAASTGFLYDNAGTLSLSASAANLTTGTLACARLPALTGDTTTSAGSCATSTVKVNGGSVPASATVLGSNSSSQLVAATLQGNGAKVQLSTGSTTLNDCVKFDANGNTVDAGAACGSGAGGVTSIATTSPITGGPITTTGTLACPTCVVSSSPGPGIAHFAGSTQAVTSSAVSLTADVSGILPAASGGTGLNTSSFTGIAQLYSGTWSVSTSLANGTTATTQTTGDGTTAVSTDAFVAAAVAPLNVMTAIGDRIGGGTSGVPARVAAGLTGQVDTATNGSTGGFASPGVGGRTVSTSTGDTILGDSGTSLRDRGTTILYTSASPETVTLAQAGTTGFNSNFIFSAFQLGAGVQTLTPTTSTVNGQSTLGMIQNSWCSVSSPDNAQYIARCATYIKAGSGLTPTYNVDGSTTLAVATSTFPTIVEKASSNTGTNYSTTSTSLVAVDATNLLYTVTIPVGSKLTVSVSGSAQNSTATDGVLVSLAGASCASPLQIVAMSTAAAFQSMPFSISKVITGDGSSHTIELCFAAQTGGTAAIFNNSISGVGVIMDFRLEAAN